MRMESHTCPMSTCAPPAGSPCRTGKGKVAIQYHTARFRVRDRPSTPRRRTTPARAASCVPTRLESPRLRWHRSKTTARAHPAPRRPLMQNISSPGEPPFVTSPYGAGLAHADALRRPVPAGEVDPQSPWTLMRGALENFATAVWLLGGDDRTERRHRAETIRHPSSTTTVETSSPPHSPISVLPSQPFPPEELRPKAYRSFGILPLRQWTPMCGARSTAPAPWGRPPPRSRTRGPDRLPHDFAQPRRAEQLRCPRRRRGGGSRAAPAEEGLGSAQDLLER